MIKAINLIIQHAKEYLDVKIEFIKLEFLEQNSKLASSIIAAVILSSVGIFSLMLLSIAAAFYLGSIWGAWYWGFLATGGFYLLLVFLLIIKRNTWIKEPLEDMIIDNYLQKEKEDQDEEHASATDRKTAA